MGFVRYSIRNQDKTNQLRNSKLVDREHLDVIPRKPPFLARLAKGIHRPLTFRILIFSSETSRPNELKLGRKPL
jgi:hypothetical protein